MQGRQTSNTSTIYKRVRGFYSAYYAARTKGENSEGTVISSRESFGTKQCVRQCWLESCVNRAVDFVESVLDIVDLRYHLSISYGSALF
jgi:hypothetical protein